MTTMEDVKKSVNELTVYNMIGSVDQVEEKEVDYHRGAVIHNADTEFPVLYTALYTGCSQGWRVEE